MYERTSPLLRAALRPDQHRGARRSWLLGLDGETKMVDGWKQKYKIDMFTSSQNQVNVLKAMRSGKFSASPRSGRISTEATAKYFEDSGSACRHGRHDGVIPKHLRVPSETIYAFIK